MRRECEVCRGEGSIHLPLYKRASAFISAAMEMSNSIEESSRRYPCPECSETVSETRLGIISTHSNVDIRYDEPELVRHIKRQMAHEFADEILKRGMMVFERGPSDGMRVPFRGAIGVVSPKAVISLERRIADRQADVASEVVKEAAASISAWGSYYTDDEGPIHKAQAIDAVRGALRRVLEKRTQQGEPA